MARLDKILEQNVRSVVIGGHLRPDGDCIGSTLAAYTYILDNYPDIEAQIYLDEFDDKFLIMPHASEVKVLKRPPAFKEYDLFLALDSADKERLGLMVPMFDGAKRTVCIDHHGSNLGFADENIISAAGSAACEILYSLMDKDKVSKDCAENLYLGLVHDTGAFKHSNVTKTTMLMAAELMDKGIRNSLIINETMMCSTYRQQQIIGRALLESILFFNGKCIFSAISQKQMAFYGVTGTDLGGIVDMLRSTAGVEVAIFLYETAPLTYKVSMRSNYSVDVSRIAVYFGGGGHLRAAGCTMRGSVYDVIRNISDELVKQMPL